MDQPTGIITFLFTDVEGSSRRWDEHPEAMTTALREHDALLRAALETHGGYVFTTAGDSFSAAFADPAAALNACVEIQRSLRAANWGQVGTMKVRIGVHTGMADERDGDYFGPALNRAARIMDAGHGGQVLLSLSTEELVRRHLPAGITLLDLGIHQLKDLGDPEQLFQLQHRDIEAEFPPLRLFDEHPNNLPHLPSSFVGRTRELADLSEKLEHSRLLTLTGVGGAGKTRLALQLAAAAVQDYANGAWLVELAPVTEPGMAVAAISNALKVPTPTNEIMETRAATGLDALVDHIASWKTLLLLDNCEHLIGAAAEIASALLLRCPDLTIIATSREGLGISGEVLWQVPSLGLPRSGDILGSESVQLFMIRSESTGTRSDLRGTELEAVADICRRLDGIPLAVELAAARTTVLTPTEIAQRLDDRFRLLTGGERTALPRHQTLEATVAWSFDLLNEPEQTTFRRLAVFSGGFTLESAEKVLVSDQLDRLEIMDHLSSLIAKSMLTRDSSTGRFVVLETLRQYGLQRLMEADEAASVRQRHLEAFRSDALKAELAMLSPEEMKARDWFTAELPNLRNAITFGLSNGLAAIAIDLLNATAWFLQASGTEDVLADAGKEALRHVENVDPKAAALLYAGTAAGLAALGDMEGAVPYARRAREIAAEVEDPAAKTEACFAEYVATEGSVSTREVLALIDETIIHAKRYHPYWLGTAYLILGFEERDRQNLPAAEDAARQCEAAFREAGAPSGIAWSLYLMGRLHRLRGDFAAELAAQQESQQIYEALGDIPGVLITRQAITLALSHLGRHDEAVRMAEELVAHSRASARDDLVNYRRMARVHRRAGLLDRLCADLREILRVVQVRPASEFHKTAAVESVLIDAGFGAPEPLTRLDGWYTAAAKRIDRSIPLHEQPTIHELRAGLEASLGSHRYAALMAEGASLSGDAAVALAQSLVAEMCPEQHPA